MTFMSLLETRDVLIAALQLLEIEHYVGDYDRFIYVNRTSMVNQATALMEQDSYDLVLATLRQELPNNIVIMWSSKTDEDLTLSIYLIP